MLVYPFKGILYNQEKTGDISKVLTPPYDVISPKMQDEYHALNPHNIVRIILNKATQQDSEKNNVYTRAAGIFKDWQKEGVFAEDGKPAFYIYGQEFDYQGKARQRLGFIGLAKIDGDPKNVVLPHEKTFQAPKEDRERLLEVTKLNTSCIFCLFQDEKREIDEIFEECIKDAPLMDTEVDGVKNRLWRISDPEKIKKIQDAMEHKNIFIADGHHRYEAAVNYRNRMFSEDKSFDENSPYNFVMMYFASFQDRGITILSTHRILKSLNGLSLEQFLKGLEAFFDILLVGSEKECFEAMEGHAEGEHVFGMYACSQYRILKLKDRNAVQQKAADGEKRSDAYFKLDSAILQTLVLDEILKIDPATYQQCISYTRETDIAIKLVDEKEYTCAFFLNPTRPHQVRDISLAMDRMPQKSTYFYPKLLTGIVLRRQDK